MSKKQANIVTQILRSKLRISMYRAVKKNDQRINFNLFINLLLLVEVSNCKWRYILVHPQFKDPLNDSIFAHR